MKVRIGIHLSWGPIWNPLFTSFCISISLPKSEIFLKIRGDTWKMTSIALTIDTLNLLEEKNLRGWHGNIFQDVFTSHFPFSSDLGSLSPFKDVPLLSGQPCISHVPAKAVPPPWMECCLLALAWVSQTLPLLSLLLGFQAWERDASPNPSASRLDMYKEVLPLKDFLENQILKYDERPRLFTQYLAPVLLHYMSQVMWHQANQFILLGLGFSSVKWRVDLDSQWIESVH